MAIKADASTHPPATNRGVETSVHESIDWISFTLPIETERVWPDGMDDQFSEGQAFNGYDVARQYTDGRQQLHSSTRPDMGIHCVLGGKACANTRDMLPQILQNVWKQGGKVTRLDIALDDSKGRINPRDATNYLQAGKVKCRAKEYPVNQDASGGGYTQYFGRMASEIHVCLYEKDAEQGICGFRVRCEIRFKKKRADKAAREYLSSNDCRGLIRAFVDIPEWPEWKEVFATKPIQVAAEKTVSNRVAWLLGQVATAMAHEIALTGGDLAIMDAFYAKVMDNLSDLKHKQG